MNNLAKAQNNGSEHIPGLSASVLIAGEQTVKRFERWEEWIEQLSFWLDTIHAGIKPCASFLCPHQDFGPDLLFALRKTDKYIILCSAQVSQEYSILERSKLNMTSQTRL